MTQNLKKDFTAQIFWLIIVLHVLLWTIVPTFTRHALPHDTIEAYAWGQHLQWGYDKNPWLSAWLTGIGAWGGRSGWLIYFIAEMFTLMSFWSVWQLGRRIFSPTYALVGAILLEGCIYYSMMPQRFNDNCIELGLWSLMFLYFYDAIKSQTLKDWTILGIIAALGMMTKYYTAVPLLMMFLFLLFEKSARRSFGNKNLYIGLLVCIIIILPHVIWLFHHQFLTVRYVLFRTENKHAYPHIYYPLFFLVNQVASFILPAILLLLLKSKRSIAVIAKAEKLNTFDKKFLLTIALGPFLFTILLSLLTGWQLYNEWGMPLLAFWGLVLLMLMRPQISQFSLKRFCIAIFILLFAWPIIYTLGIDFSKHRHSDNYPAHAIANSVTEQWHKRYHTRLKYVAGSRYVASYIAFYSKDHPAVLMEWNPVLSPWINMQDFRKYGAAFVQDGYYGTTFSGVHPQHAPNQFPNFVYQQFPRLLPTHTETFSWHHMKHHATVQVLIGFLPPLSSAK